MDEKPCNHAFLSAADLKYSAGGHMASQTFKFNPQIFKSLLNAKKFGSRIFEIERIDSTNNRAKRIADRGGEEGTLVIAETQLQGRGRHARRWHSPKGGLWFSLILCPPGSDHRVLQVIFGGCVSSVLEYYVKSPCRFHWPNDIFINSKKVGGILLESKYEGMELDYIIAGFGINVNFRTPEIVGELAVEATTLFEERGEEIPISTLLANILNKLEKDYLTYLENGPDELLHKYKHRCLTLGRWVKIVNAEATDIADIVAEAIDITEDGGLLVKPYEGEKRVIYNAERIVLLGV